MNTQQARRTWQEVLTNMVVYDKARRGTLQYPNLTPAVYIVCHTRYSHVLRPGIVGVRR